VPDFGLAHDGSLPVVPAVFAVVDGTSVRFVDAAGKKVKGWEPPGDEDVAARLAELKKKAPALVREAAERLERGMGAGRRMSREHFAEVFSMHPLLWQMSRGLVWGVFDERNALETTFTLGSRGGPVDAAGAAVTLPAGRAIGVVHPLELGEALVDAWRRKLAHTPPFEQLGRRAQRVSVEGLRQAARGLHGRALDTGVFLGLEKTGWQRGPVLDGGCYTEVSRDVRGCGSVHVAFEPGIYMGDPMMYAEQHVYAIDVRLADSTPAVATSEIERDLHALMTRSR
jgi:hypothetical protein